LAGLGNFPGLCPYGADTLLALDGGTAGGNPSNSTHLYDFAANAWRPGPALLAPLLGPAQVALPDGRVLVYGGLTGPNSATNASALLSAAPGRPIAGRAAAWKPVSASNSTDGAPLVGTGSPTPTVTATATYTYAMATC